MKVLIINQHIEDVLGGSEIQCDLITRNLIKLGHDVTYVAVNSKSQKYDTEYTIYPMRRLTFKNIESLFKNEKPDIVYYRYNKNAFLKFSLIAKKYNVKFVFSISSNNDVKKWNINRRKISKKTIGKTFFIIAKEIKKTLINRINYLGYNFTDAIVSLNKDFINLLPKGNQKKIVINNSMSSIVDKEFKWKKPFVFWVANIKQNKNPEVFIKLAKKFQKYPIDFIMVGNIQDETYSYIKNKEELPENLYYLGPKTPIEVNNMLTKSLFLVHTCNPEGFGNNFIQAWLQNKPTITLYFDPEDIIKKHSIGFHSENFNQLCKDVEYYLNNDDKRIIDGKKAKKFAQQNFSPENNVKKLEKFLLKVLES